VAEQPARSQELNSGATMPLVVVLAGTLMIVLDFHRQRDCCR
jgi:hypothetical protein